MLQGHFLTAMRHSLFGYFIPCNSPFMPFTLNIKKFSRYKYHKQLEELGDLRDKVLNIAVVDDEQIIREQICNYIGKQCAGCHVKAYETGKALLESGKHFDIVFLDIQMEGINGIETAKALRKSHGKEKETILIFVTGIREYVFDAFDVSAFHYLLKPVEEEKFSEVFGRAVEEIENRKRQKKKQLFIKSKGLILDQSSILYLESRGKKVAIHTLKETLEIYAVLGELESQLTEGFCRCHRGYLVNMAYISMYDHESITLNNGERIYMSKKKHKEFVKAYMWYLQNGGISCV